jgi:flagellar hook-associated protein 2
VSINTQARDAVFSVNGLTLQRSSNTLTDVIANTTINLGSTGNSLITISSGTDNSSTVINSFINTYNDVISQYKIMTANSTNNPTLAKGSLSDSPSLLSFVGQIKQKLSQGALTASSATISLSSLGIDFQTDGSIKFNQTTFKSSQSGGLLSTLSAGISIGGVVGTTTNLYTSIASIINPGGAIDTAITIQKNNILYTNSRATALESQLERKREGYISTYSKLNALLFQLGQSSSQLTSALTAVTNINKGN